MSISIVTGPNPRARRAELVRLAGVVQFDAVRDSLIICPSENDAFDERDQLLSHQALYAFQPSERLPHSVFDTLFYPYQHARFRQMPALKARTIDSFAAVVILQAHTYQNLFVDVLEPLFRYRKRTQKLTTQFLIEGALFPPFSTEPWSHMVKIMVGAAHVSTLREQCSRTSCRLVGAAMYHEVVTNGDGNESVSYVCNRCM